MKTIKLLAVFFSVIIVLTGCSKKNNFDVAMFRGDLARTGVYHTKGPKTLSSLKWKFKTEDKIHSAPIVFDGVIYFGSYDGYLYAVE